MNKIVAVIVTHNRLEILKHCLEALRNQLIPHDTIIVNNGSTDGTAAWLNEQQGLLIFHQDNLGSSGGFHRGIKEAYERKYEWIWLMDDDAIPGRNCLATMLKAAKETHTKYPAYFPSVTENNMLAKKYQGNVRFRPNMKMIQVHLPEEMSNTITEKIIPADFGSYLGLLLRYETISRAGFPHPDFFIHHDDLDYSIRILNNCGKLGYVKDAVIDHRPLEKTDKVYTRSILGYTFPNTGLGRLPMRYIGYRNVIYLKTQYFKNNSPAKMLRFRLFLVVWYAVNALRIVLKEQDKRIRLKFFWCCISDGLNSRFNNKRAFEIVFGKNNN